MVQIVEAIHKQTAQEGAGRLLRLSPGAFKHPQNFKGSAATHHSKLLSGAKSKLLVRSAS